ncbi:ADP-ribosyl cyclase/cyclic ADP-ribose hydrolase 2-like isoform X2 [Anneissia japonica]|uniref:ADP-ribosyl cyclase/cyclic ADP-ribose hydrolase 2-like isoform X2 n=1 Tax=Anneissia japonica TaxID=1529436 RepID=UPI00142550B8|nr:ADP-ribosyl cyclase/cyclic ADP-ribose hydrolase 2-like isoform X2 [Anneissia japonica]
MEVTALTMIVATLMSSWLAISEAKKFTKQGTLTNLREIIVGRCIEYQNGLVFTDSDIEELRSKNCTKIWEKFFNSFAHRDPCNVSSEHYEDFLQASKTTIPRNKAMYWDGWDIYQIVTNYANKGKRLVTLETTLPGYLGSGISFCGSKTDPTGLEFGNCPAEGECGFGKGAVDAFWSRLSTYFGVEGAGDVKVVFNSNRPGGAFHEEGRTQQKKWRFVPFTVPKKTR